MDNTLGDIPAYDSEEMIKILKSLSIEERAVRFFNFLNFVRELQWAGIQMRNPGLSKEGVDRKFRDEMFKLYSSDINDE
ncbi:MAG TPA: hypothetical protein PKA63_01760 [Oligoflexia bacterium]|nr:hypothetical protein [Oligoflexia bacterium]HMP47376.1 hypothetical protein [Oligoflexia bacterium]